MDRGDRALQLYELLLRFHARRHRPSQGELAEVLGITPRYCQILLADLIAARMIEVERDHRVGHRRGGQILGGNRYRPLMERHEFEAVMPFSQLPPMRTGPPFRTMAEERAWMAVQRRRFVNGDGR